MGSLSLLQGIFPTQGSNQDAPYYKPCGLDGITTLFCASYLNMHETLVKAGPKSVNLKALHITVISSSPCLIEIFEGDVGRDLSYF